MAKRKSKKRKTAHAAKAKRAPAKRKKLAAKRPARKARKAKKAKKAKRPVAAKRTKRDTKKKARKGHAIIGEGDYTAARAFDREERAFVRANKARIPQMGKEAEAALEGSEGAELMRAEESAHGHARD